MAKDVPGSFDRTSGTEEEFVEAMESGDFLPTLSTEELMRQLDIIDKLHDLGINHEGVDLPRLVVCGDQSSGKSSVLAAITRIPFPRQGQTCTRFVTQIILRHSANTSSREVSIEPGKDTEPADQDRLKGFRRQIASDFSNLPEIIAAATQSIFAQTKARHEFSEDILKIVICGKDQQPLEILDLPGLISHDKRDGLDIAAVTNIVNNHIRKKRSIVLVVVPASTDLRRHSILQTMEQIPECRRRAFGIITKPDLPRAQDLDTYMSLASNRMTGYEFEGGWHVLRNSTIEELNSGDTWQMRDDREKNFFYDSAWKQLIRQKPYDSPEQVVGILALRKRVRTLLYELNQKELPKVRREILKQLADHEKRLQDLGGERNPAQMKQRLIEGCKRLSDMATIHARGTPVPPDTSDKDLQLRARIQEMSKEFNWVVHNFGHTFAPEHFSLVAELEMSVPSHQMARSERGVNQRTGGAPNLFRQPKAISQEEYYADGLEFLSTTRGEELDTYFDPQRMTPLFQKQSEQWVEIAKHFLREFYDKVEIFLEHALRVEFRIEGDVPGKIWQRFLQERVDERKREAQAELEKLLDDRNRSIKTCSSNFRTRTGRMQSERAFAKFNRAIANEKARENHPVTGQSSVMDLESVARDLGKLTCTQMEEANAVRIQDDVLVYYVIARTTFVDNFLIQVVERHLLNRMSDLFDNVYKLSDDDVEEILREREDHKLERTSLVLKIKRLREASRILN